MSELLQQMAALAQGQQVAVGMVAAAVAGAGVFALRELPKKLWELSRDLFSVTLVVEGRDEIYPQLNRWLAKREAARRAQRLMVQDEYDYETGRWGWRLTLGRGWHLMWFEGRPVFVYREVQEGSELAKLLGGAANHKLWLISPGRSQAALRRIVKEAEKVWYGDGLVQVLFWHHGAYMLADRRPPRRLDTVFLPEAQKQRLVRDIEAFSGARALYRNRGTPYRRGYLFEGPPGTGKTSLIFALAGMLGRSVHVINLATLQGDNDLMAAFNAVGSDGVVVIEDIDAAKISNRRDAPSAPDRALVGAAQAAGKPEEERLTLSGLLNAIDGVAAREGRLLFITSNHADRLDPALLRPGRIDVREMIAPLGEPEAWAMYRAFEGEHASLRDFRQRIAGRLPAPAAELQAILQQADRAEPSVEAANA